MKKPLLNDWLVEHGLASDRKQAAALIMAGEILVNDAPARGGQKIGQEDQVRRKSKPTPFASMGGEKLQGALSSFGFSVADLVCLDAGASTGGFTDCLLINGARMVHAVDVGFGQLLGRLRQDKRVNNLEKTNLADPSLLSLSPRPSLCTCDLSYLSLKDAIPLYRQILHGQGHLIALVKPLFEINDTQARRTGVICEAAYLPLLMDLIHHFDAQPATQVVDVCASPVKGGQGTIEFFLLLRFGKEKKVPPDLFHKAAQCVDQALKTSKS